MKIKLLYIFILFCLAVYKPIYIYSQTGCSYNEIIVTHVDALTAVQNLLSGSSAEIVGTPTLYGDFEHLGTFANAGNYLDFNEGIILATGNARHAESKNINCFGFCGYTNPTLWDGTTYGSTQSFKSEYPISNPDGYEDANLNILSGSTQYNATMLEFEFIPHSSELSFDFVFASDEYLEYVGTGFNDIFGFFLSGAPIIGPYIDQGENLALVPGSSSPISINTINSTAEPTYFIDNTCYGTACGGVSPSFCCPCSMPDFQYDGLTKTLTASYSGLNCNTRYKLRIAISNIGDGAVGSAVFLKKGSFIPFNAGPATALPSPICEGQPLTLNCAGDPSYSYEWENSQGSSIGSTQTVVIPANILDPPFTVLVSNPLSNCTTTFANVNAIIHPLNNIPPYTMGIDNSEEYTFYANAGIPFNFEIFSFDNLAENINLDFIGLPIGTFPTYFSNIVTSPTINHESGSISGAIGQAGSFPFQTILIDDNFCQPETTLVDFNIVVVCPDCLVDEYYEKRGGVNVSLPSLTERVNKIVAGNSVDNTQPDGPVIVTPGENVTFEAGNKIKLEPGFHAQTGSFFHAQLINNCDTNCNDCCENFSSFTIEPIPNFLYLSSLVGNDIWNVYDTQHPFCAYGALGFKLIIKDQGEETIWILEGAEDETCCKFQSVAPNNPIPHSSIYWDGTINVGPGAGNYAAEFDVYHYQLELYGCGDYVEAYQGFITLFY